MNVKKFTAATSRDALRKVREALGPDAVILSNRAVDGVVEILALDNDDVASLASPAIEEPQAPSFPAFDNDFDPEPVFARAPAAFAPAPQAELRQPAPRVAAPQPKLDPFAGQPYVERRAAPAAEPEIPPTYVNRRAPAPEATIDMAAMTQMMSAAIAQAKESAAAEMSGMMNEIRAMRGLMETQLAELSWNATAQREPQKAAVLREMLAAGFSATLARYLVDKMPATKDAAEALRWIKTVLARNLTTIANEDDLLNRGGVFALVGPTGVGKTTTTAKLAATFAAKHGASNLGLITLDAYRVGAHEQLRAYGRILGVPVHMAHDRAALEDLLELLSGKKMILIDTAGMAQRDGRTKELLDLLAHPSIKKLLVINTAAQGDAIEDVMHAYQADACAGVILSKLDEAVKLGPALDALIRHKLKVVGVANGQRVPEDWHRLSSQALVHRALRASLNPAYRLDPTEVSLVFSTPSQAETMGAARVM